MSVLEQLVSSQPVHQHVVTGLSVVDCHKVGRILTTDKR